MSKHEIEVEGLLDGYEINEVELKTKHAWKENEIFAIDAVMHVKKKRPRRIVLEETEEKVNDICEQHWVRTDGSMADFRIISENKWREVKETEEPKLCLSVEECEQLAMDCRIGEAGEVYKKLIKFIKNNKTS